MTQRKREAPKKATGKAGQTGKQAPKEEAAEKRGRGRPTAYKPEFAAQAAKLCEMGATDSEIAGFFEVHVATVYRWQAAHPEFCDALKTGKEVANERVERSLYHKAVGYTFESVKIFMPAGHEKPVYAPYREHVPPDTTAAIFWLKNRRPDDWRDKQQHEHTGAIAINITPDDAAL